VLFVKVSKFSIIFTLGISPGSAPYPISRVLRDCHLSKSKSVIKVPPLVCGIPMIITSSLFIGFERMSKEWKVWKVHYECDIASFLR
jgi:hypothetical protein